jgi:hypothetical protein
MRLYASNSRTSKSARRYAQLHRPIATIDMRTPRIGTHVATKRAESRPGFRLADILDFGRRSARSARSEAVARFGSHMRWPTTLRQAIKQDPGGR